MPAPPTSRAEQRRRAYEAGFRGDPTPDWINDPDVLDEYDRGLNDHETGGASPPPGSTKRSHSGGSSSSRSSSRRRGTGSTSTSTSTSSTPPDTSAAAQADWEQATKGQRAAASKARGRVGEGMSDDPTGSDLPRARLGPGHGQRRRRVPARARRVRARPGVPRRRHDRGERVARGEVSQPPGQESGDLERQDRRADGARLPDQPGRRRPDVAHGPIHPHGAGLARHDLDDPGYDPHGDRAGQFLRGGAGMSASGALLILAGVWLVCQVIVADPSLIKVMGL